MISLHKPQIRLIDLLINPFIRKPKEKLLSKFKEYFNTENIILLNSARYGIKLALESIGVKNDSEVIIPSLICKSVPDAVLESGAKPIFCDVEKNSLKMDPKFCEKLITEKTKAIILPHLFGIPGKIDEFISIAKKYDISIIEDCAQAFGAEYRGKKVGTFGDFAVFSFGISKNIAATGGGLLICKNQKVCREIQDKIKLKRHQNLKKLLLAFSSIIVFKRPFYGYFYKRIKQFGEKKKDISFREFEGDISDFDSRLILSQLGRYISILHRRNNNADIYMRKLSPNIILATPDPNATPSYLFFPIRSEKIDEITSFLLKKGIEVSNLAFNEVYNDPRYKFGVKRNCTNFQNIMNDYMLLPVGHSKHVTEKICEILSFYKG